MAQPVADGPPDDDRPFPPGWYPVVVVGSGPGGLQASHDLRRAGIEHAVISADGQPAGMFQRWPLFQRLISWTKPYAPTDRGTRAYEWHDWNSLLASEPEEQALVAEFMDGTSYFPRRSEMEQGIRAFAERARLRVRYGCRWEATRQDGDGFTLTTSDGEYGCRAVVFAIGTTTPWKPGNIRGLEAVPHYAECHDADYYADRRVFVVGKRNSGFEIADGLLPWARQVILGSPSPTKLSVITHSYAGTRARYVQPYEDFVMAGGTLILDAAIESVERTDAGWRVQARGTTIPGDWSFDVDEVIAATGFTTPMLDLAELGVATFRQNRVPVQTPFFESTTLPGVYFAGCATQGSSGINKYMHGTASAAVQGFRYNSGVMVRHLAETYFDAKPPAAGLDAGAVVPFLLREASEGPELWNQQTYLARAVAFDPDRGIVDEGVVPLAHFVDAPGPDAVAVTVETDDDGDIHPALYVRRAGRVQDRPLAASPLHEFGIEENRAQVEALVAPLLG